MAAALVPLAALAFLFSYSDHLRRAEEGHSNFVDYARLIGQSSAKVMARAEGYASALSARDATALTDCGALFESMRGELREAVRLDVSVADRTICTVALRSGRVTVIRPGEADVPEDRVLPVFRENKETGVGIRIGLRPQTLLIAPIEATGANNNVGFALVDDKGLVVASHMADAAENKSFLNLVSSLDLNKETQTSFARSEGNWYVGVATLTGTRYRIVTASRPSETQLEPWLSIAKALLLPLMLLAVVFVVLRYGIQRFLLRYLRHIYATFRRYGSGETGARVGMLATAPPEINILGMTFDMMADRIEHRTKDLETSLSEQRRLTRELHHRIKNTLQMITSLLVMQRRDAKESSEKAVLRVALERVLSISAAYRISYASNEGTDVSIEALVREVVESLREPARVSQGKVRIHVAEMAHLAIDLDRAIPLAFILAELLPPRFDCLQPGETIKVEVRGGDKILILISGASQIEDVLDEFEDETPLRSRLVRAYLSQLSATCTIDGETTRLEMPKASLY
ncbi:sensor histidine kinase [Stappia sp. ICDLI1TA098]|jgi:two-component sensor histidine kinase